MLKLKNKIVFISLLFLIICLIILALFFIQKNRKKPTLNFSSSEPSEISWAKAVDLIQNCQIRTVFQKKNLEVALTQKDNQVFNTTEPKFNDIFNETNHLRSDCNDIIQTITE
jgi:sensor histidine kinase regulating citrate/malate metabolism